VHLVGTDGARVAAAAVLFAPFVPLLFMGEEYGETSPFPYFVSHGDPELVEAVRRGRAEEFGPELTRDAFDPQDPATFESAKLDWTMRTHAPNAALLDWYRALLRLRSERPALAVLDPASVSTEVFEDESALVVTRVAADDSVALVLAFDVEPRAIPLTLPGGPWRVLLDSNDNGESRSRANGRSQSELGSGRSVVTELAPRSAIVLGT
jgi:maltooligosyltrehalose trehalohydrolase